MSHVTLCVSGYTTTSISEIFVCDIVHGVCVGLTHIRAAAVSNLVGSKSDLDECLGGSRTRGDMGEDFIYLFLQNYLKKCLY